MRVLHSAMMRQFSSGVATQMLAELDAANELDIDFSVKIFSSCQNIGQKFVPLFCLNESNNKATNKLLTWIGFRKAYYSWLKNMESEVDVFVLRYSAYDPLQFLFVKNCSKPVCFVHHTKEYDELVTMGKYGYVYALVDKFFGNLSISNSKIIIGVTNEIIKYEKERVGDINKKAILYPNGVKVSTGKIDDKRNLNGVPEILFVASYFYDWHGLDLLLDDLEKSKKDFVLHLVGDLSDEDLARAKKDNRIVLHGTLNAQEIESLSEKCWIGLGSFALYRKNIIEASTLKVREYLNNGLPVYAGHIDSFNKEFAFYCFGEASIAAMLDFAESVKHFTKNQIRMESEPYISKAILLKKFYTQLCALCGE